MKSNPCDSGPAVRRHGNMQLRRPPRAHGTAINLSPQMLANPYNAIIESSDDAIISKSLSGIVTSWNPAAQRMFGYPAAEMIGSAMARLIPIDRLEEEYQAVERLFAGERVPHFETVRLHKNGTAVTISATISPLRNESGQLIGTVMIARDTTHEAFRRSAAEQCQAIIESAEDAIVSKTLDGRIVSWNQAAQRIFGYSKHEMIGQFMLRLLPRNRIDEEHTVMQKILRGERIEQLETVRLHKSGSEIRISQTVSPIRNLEGSIIGISSVVRALGGSPQTKLEFD